MADQAEKWLRENDPEYNKKEKLEYAYFSAELMRKKQRKELSTDPMTMDRTL